MIVDNVEDKTSYVKCGVNSFTNNVCFCLFSI